MFVTTQNLVTQVEVNIRNQSDKDNIRTYKG
jgi:hypothetical protein